MLKLPILEEAQRQFDVCNACRYCEGVCAVFPALEELPIVRESDLAYLANLCHDCRACYYVCPYAPPHEFGIHIPKLMAATRQETYQQYVWPKGFGERLEGNVWLSVAIACLGTLLVLAAAILGSGIERVLSRHVGPDAFYQVVPWIAMVVAFGLVSLYVLSVMLAGGVRYWRSMKPREGALASLRSLGQASIDALTLRYLRGGGPGCNYPDERPNDARRVLHSLVFYGFVAAFAATVTAAIAQDLLRIPSPYPLLSLPVLLGAVGGAGMLIGGTGLLVLKARNDARASTPSMTTMDVSFLLVLLLVNLTGFALLAFRTTPAMGTILAVHLGLTGALFLTLPYGKFVHFVYRWISLVRREVERLPGVAHLRGPEQVGGTG